jgi:DedD protein
VSRKSEAARNVCSPDEDLSAGQPDFEGTAMAKLRERNDQIEIILERRHVILLGLCALVLGSLLFLLGMLTQRNWLSGTGSMVAATKKETPPPLFPNRSSEPTVRKEDFEFYESLTGAQGKDAKGRRAKSPEVARALPAPAAQAARSEAPASSAGAASPDPSRSAPLTAAAAAKGKDEPKGGPAAKAKDEPKAPTPAAANATVARAKDEPKAPTGAPAAKAKNEPKSVPVLEASASSRSSSPPSRSERAPVKADKDGSYALQVASLTDRSSAQQYIKRLKAKGYPAFVDRARINGKLVFRVKVGNYGSKDKAQQVATKLSAEVGKQVLVQRAAEG